MAECNAPDVPIFSNTKFTVDNSDRETPSHNGIHRYQSIIGSLTYAMQGIRPDLTYSMLFCSQFLTKAIMKDMSIAKHVLQYLRGTTDLGITYRLENTKSLFVFTDLSYQDRIIQGDGRSTSGYGMYLAGGLISWSSHRQHCVTTSSTEAEYIGQANAVKQIVSAVQFILELRLPIIHLPIKLYANNISAKPLAYKPSARPRSNHIDAAMHFQREKVETGLVEIIHVASQDCAADGYTKPLGKIQFMRFRELLRLS
jgi:hypothetical protein